MTFPSRIPQRPKLDQLVRESVAVWDRMTPAEKRRLHRAQAISWVYGQLMDCAPDITKEDIARLYDETH